MTTTEQIQQIQEQIQPIELKPYHLKIEENSKQEPHVIVSVHGDNPDVVHDEAIRLYKKTKESLLQK